MFNYSTPLPPRAEAAAGTSAQAAAAAAFRHAGTDANLFVPEAVHAVCSQRRPSKQAHSVLLFRHTIILFRQCLLDIDIYQINFKNFECLQ